MKRNISVFCAALLLVGLLCLGGCGTQKQDSTLYDSRVEFVGDAPGVGNLIEQLQYGTYGSFTIALQTNKEPYGLTISYAKAPDDPEKFTEDMEKKACFLFALVDNLGEVYWDYPGKDTLFHSFTYEMACEQVGSDIRAYGTSPEKIREFADQLQLDI